MSHLETGSGDSLQSAGARWSTGTRITVTPLHCQGGLWSPNQVTHERVAQRWEPEQWRGDVFRCFNWIWIWGLDRWGSFCVCRFLPQLLKNMKKMMSVTLVSFTIKVLWCCLYTVMWHLRSNYRSKTQTYFLQTHTCDCGRSPGVLLTADGSSCRWDGNRCLRQRTDGQVSERYQLYLNRNIYFMYFH